MGNFLANLPRRTRLTRLILGFSAGALLTVVAACGGPAGSEDADAVGPTEVLRFSIASSGEVGAAAGMGASPGDLVKVVVDNDSADDYKVRVFAPDGAEVVVLRAPAGDRGQGNAVLEDPGTYTVAVSPAEDPSSAEEFPVEVLEE